MASKDNANGKSNAGESGFRISNGPVVERGLSDPGATAEFDGLPRVYGAPLLFAIPRDPRTIFAYWSVDWSDVFAQSEPVDRQVYLRVIKGDGTDESETVIEPMMGSYYAGVMQPGGRYHTELGYYHRGGGWLPVAKSEPVTMPPDRVSDAVEVDLATVPFHLSFQRLIDLFRVSRGDALSEILARLQRRAVTREERDLLTPEEWELFLAMDLSLADLDEERAPFTADSENLRKKTEAVLAFGASSPAHGFCVSGWGSSPG
jgi:hypothetical protein